VDAELGTLFDQLRAEGLLDNTLVIVTSDHGENLGDHDLWDHKFSLHRSIRHVPLVMRYPNAVAGPPRVIDDVVRIEDLFPTVLDVCGITLPGDLDSQSLLGDTSGRLARASWAPHLHALAGIRKRFPDVDPTLFEASFRAVFDGRHHLIVRSDGATELYDVVADPGETLNLAETEPERVAELEKLLDPW
jgi:arylsulfatase A-like enzyme